MRWRMESPSNFRISFNRDGESGSHTGLRSVPDQIKCGAGAWGRLVGHFSMTADTNDLRVRVPEQMCEPDACGNGGWRRGAGREVANEADTEALLVMAFDARWDHVQGTRREDPPVLINQIVVRNAAPPAGLDVKSSDGVRSLVSRACRMMQNDPKNCRHVARRVGAPRVSGKGRREGDHLVAPC